MRGRRRLTLPDRFDRVLGNLLVALVVVGLLVVLAIVGWVLRDLPGEVADVVRTLRGSPQ